jgi:hypothetical protein
LGSAGVIGLYYTTRFRPPSKGWLAARCPKCNVVRAFACAANVMTENIRLIENAADDIGEIVTCDFCGSSFAFPKGTGLVVSRDWSRGQPLQALADATNPDLGHVSEPGEPTLEQLDALLASIRGQTAAIKVEAVPGVIIGGPCGGGLGLAVGLILWSAGCLVAGPDALGQGIVFLMGGAALGAGLGAWWWVSRQSREAAAELLAEALAKHRLNREKLRLAILNNPDLSRALLPVLDAPGLPR